MNLKMHQWVLLILIGVLLGLLAVVLTLRSGALQRAGTTVPPVSMTVPPQTALPAIAEPTETPTAEPASDTRPVPTPDPAIGTALQELARTGQGRWSLCWMPLPDGDPVTAATDEGPYVSASLIKLYIMGAVYEGLESGALEPEGIYSRLHAMITVSDNASANELIRLLGGGDAETGMAAVNDWCVRQGYADTRLNRLMLAENGLQNYTTAGDCAALLAAIYRGECVSQKASEAMLALLLEQTVNDRLPALLPAGTPVAHKTGDLSGLSCCDAGIIFSPGGDYILCALCSDQPYDRDAREAIAALSKQIYEILNPQN